MPLGKDALHSPPTFWRYQGSRNRNYPIRRRIPSRNSDCVKSWQEIQVCESDANDLKCILAIRTIIRSVFAVPSHDPSSLVQELNGNSNQNRVQSLQVNSPFNCQAVISVASARDTVALPKNRR